MRHSIIEEGASTFIELKWIGWTFGYLPTQNTPGLEKNATIFRLSPFENPL